MPLRISLDSGVKVPEHHDAVEASDAAEYAAILAQPPDKLSLEQLSKGDGVTFSDGQMSIHFGNLLGIGDLEESNELPDGCATAYSRYYLPTHLPAHALEYFSRVVPTAAGAKCARFLRHLARGTRSHLAP